jgi:hypothetical protein
MSSVFLCSPWCMLDVYGRRAHAEARFVSEPLMSEALLLESKFNTSRVFKKTVNGPNRRLPCGVISILRKTLSRCSCCVYSATLGYPSNACSYQNTGFLYTFRLPAFGFCFCRRGGHRFFCNGKASCARSEVARSEQSSEQCARSKTVTLQQQRTGLQITYPMAASTVHKHFQCS